MTDEAGNLPYPVVMIPLEVTHTALATKAILGEIQSMGTPFAKMVKAPKTVDTFITFTASEDFFFAVSTFEL